MALIQCPECAKEISNTAKKCPHCGTKLKKSGCLRRFGIGILVVTVLISIFGVIGIIMDDESTYSQIKSQKKSETKNEVYNQGETVHVGYTTYAVWESWWASRLSSNEFLDQKPDAKYLFVKLTVRNDDKKPRTIAPFKLIDETGAEYQTSSNAWGVEGSIGILASLNPSVQKDGVIVFDVPTNHKYKLLVSGGYWSGKDEFIQLLPRARR